MNKEEIERYKIRDYYMIPVEVVDNMFYLFEQQYRKQKEVIDKVIELHNNFAKQIAGLIFENDGFIKFMNNLLDILKEAEND